MTKYVLKPVEVNAFEYQNQPTEDWPQWVRDYTGSAPFGGLAPISRSSTGSLLVPSKATLDGSMAEAHKGDWIVSETGKNDAFVVRGFEFHDRYAAVAE